MRKKKYFIVCLQNKLFPDDDDRLIVVETFKSIDEFEQAYNKVRTDWYEKDLYEEDSSDSLMDYLENSLAKQGFKISGFNFDSVLDF